MAEENIKQTGVTLEEVFEVVNFIKDHTASQESLDRLEQKVGSLEQKIDSMDTRLAAVEDVLAYVKAQMVTKDYLDNKLADLRGDLVVLTRKEDAKVSALVEVLKKKQIISRDEADRILAMEPFPQLSL